MVHSHLAMALLYLSAHSDAVRSNTYDDTTGCDNYYMFPISGNQESVYDERFYHMDGSDNVFGCCSI